MLALWWTGSLCGVYPFSQPVSAGKDFNPSQSQFTFQNFEQFKKTACYKLILTFQESLCIVKIPSLRQTIFHKKKKGKLKLLVGNNTYCLAIIPKRRRVSSSVSKVSCSLINLYQEMSISSPKSLSKTPCDAALI